MESVSFLSGFLGCPSKSKKFKVFDWDKAAEFIRNNKSKIESVYAGLDGDWEWTNDLIYSNDEINIPTYTYLCSNWATPSMQVIYKDEYMNDDSLESEIECYSDKDNVRFDSDSVWDEESLKILNYDIESISL